MDTQRFLAEFGHIAGAPGGLVRLRELILQLAIQGKLISSAVASESSQISLASLKAIKAQLIAEKKLPREKPYPEISVAELPTDRPLHWEWARFGEVWQLLSGRDLENNQYNGAKKGIPYITGASNIENGVINVNRWTDQPVVISVENDLLITCKGTIGKTVFNKIGEIHIARQIMAIRNFSEKMDTGFLKIWLDGFVSQLIDKSKSMIPGFSRDDLIYAIYPLPPLEEQARIVAKVDELMALCDKLETQQQKLHKLHKLSRNAVLQAISSASSKEEFHIAWLRFQHSIPLLFREESDVQHLRDVVFHLGVTGMLSSPDSQHKTLSELFIERTTSYSLDAEELARTGVRVPVLSELRIDDAIIVPINWCAMTLESACTFIIDCPHSTPKFSSTDFYCIDTTCIEPRKILWQKARTVSEDSYKERISRLRPKVGDLLFSREGTIGTAVMINDDVNLCLGQRMMLFRFAPFVLPEYAEIFLLSGYFKQQYEKFIKGTAAKHLNIGDIRQLTIAFPSIEVQRTIVDVVNKLGSHCDSLNIQLSSKAQIAQKLSEAVITTFTGIHNDEEEALKTPKTELISTLRLVNIPNINEQAPLAAILARHQSEMSAVDLWQRYGGEIDAFYAQLKQEVGKGWIAEPAIAQMQETEAG